MASFTRNWNCISCGWLLRYCLQDVMSNVFCYNPSLRHSLIAVYIDSLVMISIERSETNKKEHWKSETKFFEKGNFLQVQNFFKRKFFFFTITPSNMTF